MLLLEQGEALFLRVTLIAEGLVNMLGSASASAFLPFSSKLGC